MKLEAEILLDRGVDQQRPVEPVRRRGADLPLDPGLVEQLEHREVGGAARVERPSALIVSPPSSTSASSRTATMRVPSRYWSGRSVSIMVRWSAAGVKPPIAPLRFRARPESEIEAGPAQAGDGGEQGLLGAVDLVGEQGMEAGAAEALLLLDDQQRHFGALARQRQGGERAGDAAARDHHPCRLPRAIRRP